VGKKTAESAKRGRGVHGLLGLEKGRRGWGLSVFERERVNVESDKPWRIRRL